MDGRLGSDEPLARRAVSSDEPLARRAEGSDEPLARRAEDSDEPLARRAEDSDEPLAGANRVMPSSSSAPAIASTCTATDTGSPIVSANTEPTGARVQPSRGG